MTTTPIYNELLKAKRGVSRRKFITGIGAAATGVMLLAIGGERLLNARLPEVPGETLMRSTFAGRVGEAFQVRREAGLALPLRLVAVRDLAALAPKQAQVRADNERSFSLLFRGPADQPLDQGAHDLEHDQIGNFRLFMVPMALDEDAQYYEAIFNRQQA